MFSLAKHRHVILFRGLRVAPWGSTQVALPGPYLSGGRVNTEESK
jgi:hypothetical protein